MKKILLLGAGRSSSSLIKYLLDNSPAESWKIVVADMDEERTKMLLNNHPNAEFVKFSVDDSPLLLKLITAADIVISMLPASFHIQIAKHCLTLKKHLVTASYVPEEIRALDAEAKKSDLIFLMECGLDPGIDHMSAMQIIDRIKTEGGEINSFESYTGGLIAPESDNNPWHYKFTWNPRNVVLAGQGTAKFIDHGQIKFIPYQRLFKNVIQIKIPSHGNFEGYANRDSLSYREVYGLEKIPTLIRGTLRVAPFCSAWNVFVQLGITDDSYKIQLENISCRKFINSFLPYSDSLSVEEKICEQTGIQIQSDEMKMLEWLGIFSDEKIGLKEATPAQALQKILEEKWKLGENDKDMIVMWHRFGLTPNPSPKERGVRTLESYLVVKGDDSIYTAMAKTVGLPVGIAVKNILNGNFKSRGVVVPVIKEIYEPIMTELKNFGIQFTEHLT